MKHKKLSYRFYTTFKWLGNLATVALIYSVLKATNYDYSVLWWLFPLLMLIEFGCFAERDRKHNDDC